VQFLGHPVGIRGNEEADTAAKAGLQLTVSNNTRIAATDYTADVSKLCHNEWQRSWDEQTTNKLHSITPTIGTNKSLEQVTRHESSVLNRLRFGHTRFNHFYLLTADAPPGCSSCNCQVSVRHILLECVNFNAVRDQYFRTTSLEELFDKVSARRILDFIKDIHLFHCF